MNTPLPIHLQPTRIKQRGAGSSGAKSTFVQRACLFAHGMDRRRSAALMKLLAPIHQGEAALELSRLDQCRPAERQARMAVMLGEGDPVDARLSLLLDRACGPFERALSLAMPAHHRRAVATGRTSQAEGPVSPFLRELAQRMVREATC